MSARCSLVMFCILSAQPAFAQTSAEYFAEGRVALDKFGDCDLSLAALEKVTGALRNDPLWLNYMSRAYECKKDYEKAHEFMRRYVALFPGNLKLEDKLAELK